jgi:hypothetical protein
MLTCILLCTLLSFDDPPLKEYSPKDGTFTVLLPGEPGERANRNAGGVTWQVSAKDRLYQVARTPLPGEAPSPAQIQGALNDTRDNIAKRIQAKLLGERPLRHRDLAAREYHFELPEGKGHLRARAFYVKGHIWEIKVGGPKEYVVGPEADKIIESLLIK